MPERIPARTGRAAKSRSAKAVRRPVATAEVIGRLTVCPNCGAQRTGSFRFCRSCGLDFDLAESGSAMRMLPVPARLAPMTLLPIDVPSEGPVTTGSDPFVRAASAFPREHQRRAGPSMEPGEGLRARTVVALAAAVAVLAGLASWLVATRVP